MSKGTVVIAGATNSLGKSIAKHYVDRGHRVVVSSRSMERAETLAKELGGDAVPVGLDLADPKTIAPALAEVDDVLHVVLMGLYRDDNKVREYDFEEAIKLVTLKLVGYTEVVHALHSRMRENASILIFGGLAKDQPYPGSTTITTVNGAMSTLVNSLAIELSPIRANAIHPGQVGDSPAWMAKPKEVLDNLKSRTAMGRLVTVAEITHASVFLLENGGVNGVNLRVDGGRMMK
jgi:NAD(P)-dependent dehydrogenase (short-subunit alcohol dehydrogenase family)